MKTWCVFVATALLACLPQHASAQTTSDTIDAVLPRMVKIFGSGGVRNLEAYGTGFLVSAEGHVATVWSHVLDRNEVVAVLHDGRRMDAQLVGFDPELDLAVLKLQDESLSLPHFNLDESGFAGSGTRVLAFSNMFKVATGDEAVSVLHGVIAAHTQLSARRGAFEVPYEGPVYIVDAITNNSGAAGGVLTTRDGVLLGMIGKELRNTLSNTWINYAVPGNELRETVDQIIAGNFSPRRKTGTLASENPQRYAPADFGLVMLPDVLHRTPAYLDSVMLDSPAEKVGLSSDDLVLFINDELVGSTKMFNTRLGQLEAGDKLRIVVRRGDRLITVEMPVEKKGGR